MTAGRRPPGSLANPVPHRPPPAPSPRPRPGSRAPGSCPAGTVGGPLDAFREKMRLRSPNFLILTTMSVGPSPATVGPTPGRVEAGRRSASRPSSADRPAETELAVTTKRRGGPGPPRREVRRVASGRWRRGIGKDLEPRTPRGRPILLEHRRVIPRPSRPHLQVHQDLVMMPCEFTVPRRTDGEGGQGQSDGRECDGGHQRTHLQSHLSPAPAPGHSPPPPNVKVQQTRPPTDGLDVSGCRPRRPGSAATAG
ncbi:hypothetical protein ElP_57670 [Tautonia plasticadhaerens]|uniref:Uncharacterized protein n=1 Tax=Tautonia plasticadhaerens TaxID=2527974 RepID=A0A518HAD5_9BACT|nr:hypothetical protein ElP_57670 [Tautonia plasticadhaerens]